MTKVITSDIVLELHVPDFRPVIQFYSLLGFKKVWINNDKEGYLVMKRDKSILNFYCGSEKVYEHSFFKRFPKATVRGYGVEIVLPIRHIDKFYKTVCSLIDEKKLNGEIVEELALKPWGKMDFRMTDPFGFYLRFTEITNWLIP
ncbi:protein containg glyoxalase-like domain [Longilinea arvoryzae]|uniref:Protein containg glyoxalase-like domain n=1 Tax=Longilinea arvoryzae TaxID=360412 RepID=A0A0S7B796_9CHLR|nr:hypothetical protein [Longilinea arvoryzae]GAP13228.1 protein containg glyoxalase-like domain [Longilinea arvoryzae]